MLEEETQTWHQALREALNPDGTHHTPNRNRRASFSKERQPKSSTRDKVCAKNPEKKICGWPGVRFVGVPKPKKGKGHTKKL